MRAVVDRLLSQYEGGRMTRRDLVLSLTALAATPAVAAQDDAPIPVKSLNHVTIFVSDTARSLEFYQGLFGMPVLSRQGGGANLAIGDGPPFLGVFGGRDGNADIGHFCFGVENFSSDRIVAALAERGIEARVRMRDGTIPEVYLRDPDGIQVQIQDASYCGGGGPLGNECD